MVDIIFYRMVEILSVDIIIGVIALTFIFTIFAVFYIITTV